VYVALSTFMPIGCRDTTIFRCFKMTAIHDLGSVISVFGPPRRVFGGLCYSAEFGQNLCRSFDNMQVLIFGTLDLKMPIHDFKMLFGEYAPNTWSSINATPKMQSLGRNMSYDV